MRRRKVATLARLKEEARVALREAARRGEDADAAALAEKLAPSDEDELFSLARHAPQLRPNVREAVVAALERTLEDERRAIEKGGAAYLELQDKDPCCGG